MLTGAAGSPTAGLALTINGGATGARGTVTYSEGYANQLNTLLTSYLGTTGPLNNETSSLNNSITSLSTQISALNVTLAAQQKNYLAEFQALDTTISSLDATQTFLTQQLHRLPATAAAADQERKNRNVWNTATEVRMPMPTWEWRPASWRPAHTS